MVFFKIFVMLRMSLCYVNIFKCLMVFMFFVCFVYRLRCIFYLEYLVYYCFVNVFKWICFGEKIFDKILKLFKSLYYGYICFDG